MVITSYLHCEIIGSIPVVPTMKKNLQLKAVQLRKRGFSIREIELNLGVSRSTVSRWVKGICLSEINKKRMLEKQAANGRLVCLRRSIDRQNFYSKNRELGYARAIEDVNFRTICALYWGEGRKAGARVELSNSDFKMVRVWVNWLLIEKKRNIF